MRSLHSAAMDIPDSETSAAGATGSPTGRGPAALSIISPDGDGSQLSSPSVSPKSGSPRLQKIKKGLGLGISSPGRALAPSPNCYGACGEIATEGSDVDR